MISLNQPEVSEDVVNQLHVCAYNYAVSMGPAPQSHLQELEKKWSTNACSYVYLYTLNIVLLKSLCTLQVQC